MSLEMSYVLTLVQLEICILTDQPGGRWTNSGGKSECHLTGSQNVTWQEVGMSPDSGILTWASLSSPAQESLSLPDVLLIFVCFLVIIITLIFSSCLTCSFHRVHSFEASCRTTFQMWWTANYSI